MEKTKIIIRYPNKLILVDTLQKYELISKEIGGAITVQNWPSTFESCDCECDEITGDLILLTLITSAINRQPVV